MQQIINSFDFFIPVFLFVFFIAMILMIGYGVYQSKKGKKVLWGKLIGKVVLTLIVIGMITVTCMPSSVRHAQPRAISFIPFYDYFKPSLIGNNLPSIYLLNIILFIPFGFVMGMLHKEKRIAQMTFYGFLFSLCIETIQYVLPLGRTTTIDDLLLNTLGAFLGVLLSKVMSKMIQR